MAVREGDRAPDDRSGDSQAYRVRPVRPELTEIILQQVAKGFIPLLDVLLVLDDPAAGEVRGGETHMGATNIAYKYGRTRHRPALRTETTQVCPVLAAS